MQTLVLIVLSVSLSATAQIVLKIGVNGISRGASAPEFLASAALDPRIILGAGMHVAALALWLLALRQTEVSFAYPFIALGMVLVLAMSALWLGESVNATRIAGVALIVCGIVLVGRS